MEKIKEIMKWIATDGLLHMLACGVPQWEMV